MINPIASLHYLTNAQHIKGTGTHSLGSPNETLAQTNPLMTAEFVTIVGRMVSLQPISRPSVEEIRAVLR